MFKIFASSGDDGLTDGAGSPVKALEDVVCIQWDPNAFEQSLAESLAVVRQYLIGFSQLLG
jgi:hypothetical protein